MFKWIKQIAANLRKPSDAEIIKRKKDAEDVAKFHAELEASRRKAIEAAEAKLKAEIAKVDNLDAKKVDTGSIPVLTLPATKKPAAKKAPAKKAPAPVKEASRDGDGDGIINDGKSNQRKAPAKKTTK